MDKKKYLYCVKNKLLKDNTSVFKVDFSVSHYKEAVNEWIKFKKNNKHDNYTIYSIFSFHLNNDEHVILYHKKYDENCLLLCKINKIYKNIIIPCNNNIIYDKDIVATYL